MIPAMTDPLGEYWHQPRDIREAPMDDEVVLLTPAQFAGLAEYSSSHPSGVYPGKCWRRFEPARQYPRSADGSARPNKPEQWWLGWYGIHDDPRLCSNNWRKIVVVE